MIHKTGCFVNRFLYESKLLEVRSSLLSYTVNDAADGIKELQMSLSEDDRRSYISGLHRFKNKGVRIYVDGVEDEGDWHKIVRVCDSAVWYYMGDFIVDPSTGTLKEIRFDKIRKISGRA